MFTEALNRGAHEAGLFSDFYTSASSDLTPELRVRKWTLGEELQDLEGLKKC